ncbi:DUF222 domain-containing protein, partial [Mycobacterium sp.]|uniref:DUF222 domain-containing protein n=1 Tax=Mycobacterium sp. TaxID=1785 RepID=UPI002D2E00A5
MDSDAAEQAVAACDALDGALALIEAVPFDALSTREQLNMLERQEKAARRLPSAGHELINQIGEHADPAELGGSLPRVLADRLRITPAEARRRVRDAEQLGPRTSLTGEPLGPWWPATAAAQRAGQINNAHVGEIRRFFKQ